MDLDNIQRKYGLPAPLPVVQNGKFATRFPLNLEHRGDDVFQFGGKYIGEIENIYDLLYKILTNQEIDASLALPYAIKITEDKLYIRDKTNSEWILIFDITKPNFPKEIELYELIYKAITHQVIGEDTSYPGQFKIEENILYVRDKDNLTWTQIGDVTKEFLGATEATQAILEQVNDILTEVQELKTELNRQIATTNETLTTALQAANEAMTSAQSINIRTFNSVEEMKASNTLKAGALAKTQGFYQINDGGAAEYIIISDINEDEVDGARIISLQNNLYAELMIKDVINVKQWGAYGDGIHDDTVVIQKAYYYGRNNNINKNVYVPTGTYKLTDSIVLLDYYSYGNYAPKLIGDGRERTIFDVSSMDSSKNVFTIKGASGVFTNVGGNGFSINAIDDGGTNENNPTAIYLEGACFTDWNDIRIKNCGNGLYLSNNREGAFTEINRFTNIELQNCYNNVKIEQGIGNNSFHGNMFEVWTNNKTGQTSFNFVSGIVYNCRFILNMWGDSGIVFFNINSNLLSRWNFFDVRVETNKGKISGNGTLWGFGHFGGFPNGGGEKLITDETDQSKTVFCCSDFCTGTALFVDYNAITNEIKADIIQSPTTSLLIGTKNTKNLTVRDDGVFGNFGFSFNGNISASSEQQQINVGKITSPLNVVLLCSVGIDTDGSFYTRRLYAINLDTSRTTTAKEISNVNEYDNNNGQISIVSIQLTQYGTILLNINANKTATYNIKVMGVGAIG